MIKILSEHRQELEKELRERVQAFFAENNEAPESVSIEMAFNESKQSCDSSVIQILVKDAVNGSTIVSA